ncbi:MAG: helix-turn-helix transcriptional regulator [Phycisphaerales bacterium]|nr:helix-turn-helix transcriptional regulator [Phycisphaerales bacterium]
MPTKPTQPIGEIIRHQRTEVLMVGLRDMAKLLEIAPAHLTDIEKGRRSPSEALLLRITIQYKIDEATLRAGWGKAESDVGEIASSNAINAAKAPELLRAAKDLDAKHWDALISQARTMADKVARKTTKPPKS